MAGTSTNHSKHQSFDEHYSHSTFNDFPSSSSSSNLAKTLNLPFDEQRSTIEFVEDQRFSNRLTQRRSIDLTHSSTAETSKYYHHHHHHQPSYRKQSLSSFDERYFSQVKQRFGDFEEGELDMPLSRTAKRLAALGGGGGQSVEENNESNSEFKGEWWENVLPPGQLTERLKRAQPIIGGTSSSSSSSQTLSPSSMRTIVEDSDKNGIRHSRKSILRSSVVEGSQTQSSQNTSSSSTPMLLSPTSYSSNINRDRAGTWSSQSSTHGGSNSTFSTRSSMSVGDLSSSNSSNDESPSDLRSPTMAASDEWSTLQHTFGDRTSGSISPTSITRSKSNRRRRRVESDMGLGLGVAIRAGTGNVMGLEERFEQWNDGYTFGGPQQQADRHQNPGLRPFPSASKIPLSRTGSYLSDTPEHSSAEEDQQHYHVSHRPFRTSSTRTSETVCDPSRQKAASLASAPSSRRSSITAMGHGFHSSSRRVSFSQEVEVVQSNDVKETQTIGRAHGRSMSNSEDKYGSGLTLAHPFPSLSERFSASNGENKQRKQSSSLRTSTESSHKRSPIPSHLRGKRSTCYSAPTSPRLTTMQMSELRDRHGSKLSRESTPNSSGRSTPRSARSRRNSLETQKMDADVAKMAILTNSLDVAPQLSSARTLAMALTRQLSAPLRPFFHLTLLVSISSAAFVALAGFLVAGYMCTFWDDIGSRGKSLQSNVSSAKKTIESRVKWTRTMLGYTESDGQEGNSTSTKNAKSASETSSSTSDSTSTKTTQAIIMPFRFAIGLPFTVAYNLTPDSVRNVFQRSAEEKAFEQTTKVNPNKTFNGSSNGPSGSKRTFSRRTTRNTLNENGNGFHSLPPRPPLSSLLPSIAFTIVIAFGAGLASFFANRAATATAETTAGSTLPATTRANSRPSSSGTNARRHSHNHHYHRFDQTPTSSSNKGGISSTFPTSSSSSYARPRSSNSFSSVNTNDPMDVNVGFSNDLHTPPHHSRHSSIGVGSGISGRKSPYNWQEGVSSFS